MGIFNRKSGKSPEQETASREVTPVIKLVDPCYCGSGHNLISDKAIFSGQAGITLKLRNASQEGILSLSPIIGDHDRTFFDAEWITDEIVEICCPTCSEPLPVYNECFCGADLVAIFTKDKNDFANCVGICQRIGCAHSEIISNYDLRVNSRRGAFDKGTDLYGRS